MTADDCGVYLIELMKFDKINARGYEVQMVQYWLMFSNILTSNSQKYCVSHQTL